MWLWIFSVSELFVDMAGSSKEKMKTSLNLTLPRLKCDCKFSFIWNISNSQKQMNVKTTTNNITAHQTKNQWEHTPVQTQMSCVLKTWVINKIYCNILILFSKIIKGTRTFRKWTASPQAYTFSAFYDERPTKIQCTCIYFGYFFHSLKSR
jgi:hypothetical protein